MNMRWFSVFELRIAQDAPGEDELVWAWFARTRRVNSYPMTLNYWNSEDCRAGIAKHHGEEFAAAQKYRGWRLIEQAHKIYLEDEDKVCRVVRPEEPL